MYDWINAFLKPAGHTIVHFDEAFCGHINCVGQTNVVQKEFLFPPPSSTFVTDISDVGQSISSFLSLKNVLVCSSQSLVTFFLNNTFVKCIFSLFPPLTVFSMVVCK